MFRGLLYKVPYLWKRLRDVLPRRAQAAAPVETPTPELRRLQRVFIAEDVMQMLFEDFAAHRRTARGVEEIGWILLGVWQDGEPTVLAAIPAGADRDASASHVRFNADAQALATRILRQQDKRLTVIGVVHTHPGSMRYPSDGDLMGDSRWVGHLREGAAVFGIGTADGERNGDFYSELCFSWYSLGVGDSQYQPLPVVVQAGADLAAPIRPTWNLIETHAEPLNRLCRQLRSVHLDVVHEGPNKLLVVKIALGAAHQQLRLLLSEGQARYYWDRQGELIAVDPHEGTMERAVYLILAELAKEMSPSNWEARMLVRS
jgi:proteasome lid subunit RPN8/RPN11